MLEQIFTTCACISVQISCNICSKKVKVTKAVNLGEKDYCDPCFRRQFLLRSAIEHFMVYIIMMS